MVVSKYKGLKWTFIISIIILIFSPQTIFAVQNNVYEKDYLDIHLLQKIYKK